MSRRKRNQYDDDGEDSDEGAPRGGRGAGKAGRTVGTVFNEEDDAKKKFKPEYQQIVTDERGVRRFHGAFTGGFSAGYYNSVGTKEGWAPSEWKSSRSSRPTDKVTKPEDYMDEEDMNERLATNLTAKSEFGGLGGTAEELSRKRKATDQPGAGMAQGAAEFSGFIASELAAPVQTNVGQKLLRLMGWREGQGVGPRQQRKRKVVRQEPPAADEPMEETTTETAAPTPMEVSEPAAPAAPKASWRDRKRGADAAAPTPAAPVPPPAAAPVESPAASLAAMLEQETSAAPAGGSRRMMGPTMPPPAGALGGGAASGKPTIHDVTLDDGGDEGDEEENDDNDIHAAGHSFAPKAVHYKEYLPKTDFRGIGFNPLAAVPDREKFKDLSDNFKTHYKDMKEGKKISRGTKVVTMSDVLTGEYRGDTGGAFGFGAFEDGEDEDVYGTDRPSGYSHEIMDEDEGGSVMKSLSRADKLAKSRGKAPPQPDQDTRGAARWDLSKMFVSATRPPDKPRVFDAPKPPANFNPMHKFDKPLVLPPNVAARGRGLPVQKLTAEQRTEILSDKPAAPAVPSGSVFNFMSEKERARMNERVASAKSGGAPPPGAAPPPAPSGFPMPGQAPPPMPMMMPPTAATFQPFRADPAKQERYNKFLLRQQAGTPMEPPPEHMTEWERAREEEEFRKSAALFMRPMSAQMASRFTRSADDLKSTGDAATGVEDTRTLEFKKAMTDAEYLAQAKADKMFGKTKRTVEEWRPALLVCKRFNVRDPYEGRPASEAPVARGSMMGSTGGMAAALDFGGVNEGIGRTYQAPAAVEHEPALHATGTLRAPTHMQVEVEEPAAKPEPPKPSIDIFKAIFESDDEDAAPIPAPTTVTTTTSTTTTATSAAPTPMDTSGSGAAATTTTTTTDGKQEVAQVADFYMAALAQGVQQVAAAAATPTKAAANPAAGDKGGDRSRDRPRDSREERQKEEERLREMAREKQREREVAKAWEEADRAAKALPPPLPPKAAPPAEPTPAEGKPNSKSAAGGNDKWALPDLTPWYARTSANPVAPTPMDTSAYGPARPEPAPAVEAPVGPTAPQIPLRAQFTTPAAAATFSDTLVAPPLVTDTLRTGPLQHYTLDAARPDLGMVAKPASASSGSSSSSSSGEGEGGEGGEKKAKSKHRHRHRTKRRHKSKSKGKGKHKHKHKHRD